MADIMQAIADAKRAIFAAEPSAPNAAEGDPDDTNTEPTNPNTPAEPDDEPAAEEEQQDEPTIGDVAKRCDALEARVSALEEAAQKATADNAALTGTLREATGTITRLVAILRDPARAQAYARGETEPAHVQDAPEAHDVLKQYLALKPGSSEAKDFYKAHAAEIAARANAR